MRKLLTILMILALPFLTTDAFWIGQTIAPASAPPPPSCNTYPGLTCDVNGFTVFTPVGTWCEGNFASSPACNPAVTDTQIIYIAVTADVGTGQAAGIDQSGCGTWAAPCLTPFFAAQHYGRASTAGVGSPDWFLMKCGDTWSYSTVGNVRADAGFIGAMGGVGGAYGNPTTGPLLISSYDASVPHVGGVPPVPNPTSCSARPIIIANDASRGGVDSNGSVAVVGLEVYCNGRDPNNGAFSPLVDAQEGFGGISFAIGPSGVYSPPGAILAEDNLIAFCGGALSVSDGTYPNGNQWYTGSFFRRNILETSYPVNTESAGVNGAYVLGGVGGVGGTPANSLYYQNVIDNQTWVNYPQYSTAALGISWAPKSVFSHNLYIGGIAGNGDVLATNNSITFDGNVLSNDPSGTAFRTSGLYNNNLFLLNERSLPFQLPNAMTSSVNKNVFTDMINGAAGSDGAEIITTYVDEEVNAGTANVTTNIFANSPLQIGAAITFNSATQQANGITVSGNYLWDVSGFNNTTAISGPSAGGIINGTFTAGSSYTASGSTITGAAASTESPISQNYVVLSVTDQTGRPNLGIVYSLAGNLGTIAGQPKNITLGSYQAESCGSPNCNSNGQNFVLFGSNYSGSYTGSVYYPYQAVALSCSGSGAHCHCIGAGNPDAGCAGAAGGVTADVIADGSGHVVALSLLGDDGLCTNSNCTTTTGSSSANSPGANYTMGDVLSIPALGGTGSGALFTVTQVASNTISGNFNDAVGAGTFGWPDPNRTAGWYYATHVSGATANATFTGVISSSGTVLTVSSISGGKLYPGDAVYWTSPTQAQADYIVNYSGGVIFTLGSPTASACSVSPAGCQGVGGISALASSTVGACGTGRCAANTYTNVPLVGGKGTGALATIVVTNVSGTLTITSNTITTAGEGYSTGDVLSATSNTIGGPDGGGTNYTVSPASIVSPLVGPFTFTGVPLIGGHGTGAAATVVVASGIVTTVTLTSAGSGYVVGDVLTTGPGSNAALGTTGIGGQNQTGIPGHTSDSFACGNGNTANCNGLTNFTVTVTAITHPGSLCGGSACTGDGGNGTYVLTGANNGACGGGGCSMSSYTSEQLIQAMYGQSRHNWQTALTAPVINSVIAAGFGLTW